MKCKNPPFAVLLHLTSRAYPFTNQLGALYQPSAVGFLLPAAWGCLAFKIRAISKNSVPLVWSNAFKSPQILKGGHTQKKDGGLRFLNLSFLGNHSEE
jgi:hypothetical protein